MMNYGIWHFLQLHNAIFWQKLGEHVYLSVIAVMVALVIGLPLGILINRVRPVRPSVLGLANIFQTIPSLALLAFLIPLVGIGMKPTVIALTIYALLPIIRNTYTGLNNVPKESIEAADSLGFTKWQKLKMVEIPLAAPIIIAGIRTATVITIGITTIAAFIGAGGLGDFITQGLALNDTQLILLGAIPAALLALLADFIIAQTEALSSARQRRIMRYKKTKITFLIFIAIASLSAWLFEIFETEVATKDNTITIATKNFTEQYILGNMIAELISAKTKLHVIKKFNLGPTAIVHNAIVNGEISLYPEYTGTAYLVVLHHHPVLSSKGTYHVVQSEYLKRFKLTWLPPFGFENSQTLAVRNDFAQQHNLATLSDLQSIASRMTVATPAAFLQRPDGMPGLKRVYHLNFRQVFIMQPNLMYAAIKNKDVDSILVFTTDGRIRAYHLKPLADNLHFYPPYYAAIVVRTEILRKHPEIEKALAPLFGAIDTKTMRRLNYAVDVQHQTPAYVAHHFLRERGLL